jgi:hypothetical protein
MRLVTARFVLLLGGALAACDPQVVDAVASGTTGAGTGGVGGAGGGSGAGAGGTDVAGAGTGGTEVAGSGGSPCDPSVGPDPDGDGISDCADPCRNSYWKQLPGTCGCEFPDTEDVPESAACAPILDVLVHRYSFSGTSTTVIDSAGEWDGTLFGDIVPTGGALTLGGGRRGEYVNLPNGILSRRTSVTVDAWVTWAGGADWQRVFDFGDDDTSTEGSRGIGRTYLFLTPALTVAGEALARVSFQGPSIREEVTLNATRSLPIGSPVHVVFTFDDETKRLALYIDGALDAEKVLDPVPDVPMELDTVNDINCWLGRSQYSADADFGGSIDEFRIYSVALTAAQVRTINVAGPNPAFFP